MKFNEIGKKLRIAIVISITWMGIVFVLALDASSSYDYGFRFAHFITGLVGGGVLPVFLLWGIIWILAASKQM